MLHGEIYHASGRANIDKPTLDLIWRDDVAGLKEENRLLKDCILEMSEILYGGA